MLRDGKKIILDELGPGSCFGEMAPILGGTRSATVTCTSFTELYVIDKNSLDKLLKQANPMLRATIHSLIKRLRKLNESAIKESNPSSPIEVYANILTLLAYAANNQGRQNQREARDDSSSEVPMHIAIKQINLITGDARFHIEAQLKEMAKIKLIDIQGTRKNPVVKIKPNGLRDQAKAISKNIGDSSKGFQTEQDLLDLDQLSSTLDIEKENILQTLADGKIDDDCVIFRKNKFEQVVRSEGKDFFLPTKPGEKEKRLQFDQISDIEFLDRHTLFKVIANFDRHDLAKIISKQPDTVQRRLFQTMSKRNKADVQKTLHSVGEVDKAEYQTLSNRFIDIMRKLTQSEEPEEEDEPYEL